jgi:restriction system protein
MRNYYRVSLGAKNAYAKECYENKYIGTYYDIQNDLTKELTEQWREFNAKYIDIWLGIHPGKSKVAAGLACASLWVICKGIKKEDIVFCPDGEGNYYVGEIISEYYYVPDTNLPHRRNVRWYSLMVERTAMSEGLRRSTSSGSMYSTITQYADEIAQLIENVRPPTIISTDDSIEDPSMFALEKHLEDFLVQNWKHTELGKDYDIYEVDGEIVGRQYPSDTGPIDVLAISKNKKTLLVVELKKGRVSDNVVGQIQRYMGYVKDELAESNQEVKGVIIGMEDDIRIRRALSVTTNIEFYRYRVNFKLFKNSIL